MRPTPPKYCGWGNSKPWLQESSESEARVSDSAARSFRLSRSISTASPPRSPSCCFAFLQPPSLPVFWGKARGQKAKKQLAIQLLLAREFAHKTLAQKPGWRAQTKQTAPRSEGTNRGCRTPKSPKTAQNAWKTNSPRVGVAANPHGLHGCGSKNHEFPNICTGRWNQRLKPVCPSS